VLVNTDQQIKDKQVTLDSPLAVEAHHVTVSYRSYQRRPSTMKESILNFVKKGALKYYSTFDALSDVSFSIPKGQVTGFIGSNGAGKSTLLKVLAGVLPPSKGHVNVSGKVDSLIQLGAGFDPDLDAIENIYLSASLHKQTKAEIKQKVPKILEFAELQQFANTPIRYYSSGMFARLGFSVAIDRDPDILIVDEVIGVGDERFQNKCVDVFHQLIKRGKTIIIVSHDMNMLLPLATSVGVLSKGRLVYLGSPQDAIEKYRSQAYETALSK